MTEHQVLTGGLAPDNVVGGLGSSGLGPSGLGSDSLGSSDHAIDVGGSMEDRELGKQGGA